MLLLDIEYTSSKSIILFPVLCLQMWTPEGQRPGLIHISNNTVSIKVCWKDSQMKMLTVLILVAHEIILQ